MSNILCKIRSADSEISQRSRSFPSRGLVYWLVYCEVIRSENRYWKKNIKNSGDSEYAARFA